MAFYKYPLLFLLFISLQCSAQQDMDFDLTGHLLQGDKILKIKRDFYDPYLWALAQNNRVYRINTQTQAIDDYTAKFSAYSKYQFIDIAGESADTVFIATSTPNVIQYGSGTISVIGAANGLKAPVNSIGIGSYYDPQIQKANLLLIATSRGLYNYHLDTYQMDLPGFTLFSKVYEAAYRREMYADSSLITQLDTPRFLQAYALSTGIGSQTYLPEGGNRFGFNINTAYCTTATIYNMEGLDVAYQMMIYWGNAKGLFQASNEDIYSVNTPYNLFLPGININKITGILGLTSFGNGYAWGNPGLIKENLLVGTDTGFYFSNSIYGDGTFVPFSLSFFHYDPMGSIRVNDIAVSATSTTQPICENAVYVATDNGIYLLTTDYGKYINVNSLAAARFKGISTTVSQLTICGGSSITAQINDTLYTGNTVQWYRNSSELPNQFQDTLSITTAGDYYAMLYDPCTNIKIPSNHLTVQVINSPVFTFNYPDEIPQCNNSPDTLKVTYNPGYHYRWYTNDTLNNDTTSSYIATQSGKYKVEVSACTNSWVPSKEVQVDFINLPSPKITADKTQYCAEDTAKLTVNTPTDPSYSINWYQNGNVMTANQNQTTIKVTTGGNYTAAISSSNGPCTQTSAVLPVSFTPSPVFSFNYPPQMQYCVGTPVTLTVSAAGSYQYQWYRNDTLLIANTTASLNLNTSGTYKAELSSCPGSWVATKEVQVNFIYFATPIITADKPAYCQGDQALLAVNFFPDPSYTINWFQNGNLLGQFVNQNTITTTNPGSYTVSVTANAANTDGSICSSVSAAQTIVFNIPPTVSIQQTASSGFCQGQTVTLTAQHSAGTVLWSTGEATDQITVRQTGSYTATVTTAGGCQAGATQTVTFLADPEFTVNDTTICTYKKQVITLTAPAGYSGYSWNDGASTQNTYEVSRPGTVTLTITDNNGCQATRQIKVSEQCPNVYIPNTFTPNGDGVNDTWDIEGLDATATVKVFTRWGTEVYQSAGYNSPWNGQYNGKKLSPGVYYYIVTSKNNTQKYSGSLTIIY